MPWALGMQHLCVHTQHLSPPFLPQNSTRVTATDFLLLGRCGVFFVFWFFFDEHLSFLGCLFWHRIPKKSNVKCESVCGMGRRMGEDGATAPFIFLFFLFSHLIAETRLDVAALPLLCRKK